MGHTRQLKCLVHAGAPINVRDGIGQTALTISLHKNNNAVSVFLIKSGACVQEEYYENTVSRLAIAKLHKNDVVVELIEERIRDEKRVLDHVSKFFPENISGSSVDTYDHFNQKENFSRALNINIGDQKNTVTVLGCASACPDIYGCHTPGTGDFHNRGYLNETRGKDRGARRFLACC